MAIFSKSDRNNRPIIDTWVGFVPFGIVLLSIIITLAWTRWQLVRSASAFQKEFLQQNLTELAAGDTMTLSRRLEALSNSIHWSCIEGRRQNNAFFVRHRGACGSGFFHQEVDLAAPGNQDIQLKATLSLPSDLLGIAVILMVGQLGLFALLWRSTQIHERIRLNSLLEKERAESAVNRAVAGMTSMLAHDIRNPFSILRTGIALLSNAKDLNGVKKILGLLVPEIDKAVSSIDGLISDVMEVGSSSTELIQEPLSPESLIESTLGEIFRVYPKSDVTIAYDLKHSHMVNVHALKIARVFSNILGNAIQAMNYKGSLWIKTREQDGFVEFCLGNAGSMIPPESLSKLFDSFFTSGKKGGTGLGLAIAEKVVKAHGGRIWCESSKTALHPEGKVEFFFTLPIGAGHSSNTTATLPKHSSEILQALAPFTAAEPESLGSIGRGEITLEADIIQAKEGLGRLLRVLVVDDEAIYRSAVAAYFGRTSELLAAVSLTQASNAAEALGAIRQDGFDLVITDVDMGLQSLDGFDLVRGLRAKGIGSLICVHSNRNIAADHKTAIEAGADAFLPKPIARAQLLRLVLQAAQKATFSSENAVPSVATVPAAKL